MHRKLGKKKKKASRLYMQDEKLYILVFKYCLWSSLSSFFVFIWFHWSHRVSHIITLVWMKTELVPLTNYSTYSYEIDKEINEERWEDWFCQFCQTNNRKQIPSWPSRFLFWSPSFRLPCLHRRRHTVNMNVRRKKTALFSHFFKKRHRAPSLSTEPGLHRIRNFLRYLS